jgi:hypothetical protein
MRFDCIGERFGEIELPEAASATLARAFERCA